MVISAAAPLTGVAGAMPLAFLLGNWAGVPLSLILLTLVVLDLAAGCVAMTPYVTNAMQFGLIGLFGGTAASVVAPSGLVPILNMFTWVSQVGTLGVLAMMAVASLSVVLPALIPAGR